MRRANGLGGVYDVRCVPQRPSYDRGRTRSRMLWCLGSLVYSTSPHIDHSICSVPPCCTIVHRHVPPRPPPPRDNPAPARAQPSMPYASSSPYLLKDSSLNAPLSSRERTSQAAFGVAVLCSRISPDLTRQSNASALPTARIREKWHHRRPAWQCEPECHEDHKVSS